MNKKAVASAQAAQAITVGILLDQTRALRKAGALRGEGVPQALKVEKWAQAVLDSIPVIKSARGVKNIERVCDTCHGAFRTHYSEMDADAVMGALVAVFSAHATMSELIRAHRLNSAPWRYLDMTSTKLMALMLADIPEEEERMWIASQSMVDVVMEIAA